MDEKRIRLTIGGRELPEGTTLKVQTDPYLLALAQVEKMIRENYNPANHDSLDEYDEGQADAYMHILDHIAWLRDKAGA